MLSQHVAPRPDQTSPPVLFHADGGVRRFVLNRPAKLNALDRSMIDLMRPKLQEWDASELCTIIVGSGEGRAFCAGGDVRAVVENISQPTTRPLGAAYFKAEFELDYQLANLTKPYVAICDVGGGVGLVANAPFRVATERTKLAMPETKIGYAPDVGASFFLSRLDGEIGTYLALTGATLEGREVFELGLSTHFMPSSRVETLISSLASLNSPNMEMIARTIEELCDEEDKGYTAALGTTLRSALDSTFAKNSVEDIFADLTKLSGKEAPVGPWAEKTLFDLRERSPLSLKIALELVRRGKKLSLADALRMEYKMATAFCNGASEDFRIGVTAVLIERSKGVPGWENKQLAEVTDDFVKSRFFGTGFNAFDDQNTHPLELNEARNKVSNNFGLPKESEIKDIITGSHPACGEKVVDEEGLLDLLRELYPGKVGLEAKVKEVIRRKCHVVAGPVSYLAWSAP